MVEAPRNGVIGMTDSCVFFWALKASDFAAWVPQHLSLLLDVNSLHAVAQVPSTDKAAGWLVQDLQRLQTADLEPARGGGA